MKTKDEIDELVTTLHTCKNQEKDGYLVLEFGAWNLKDDNIVQDDLAAIETIDSASWLISLHQVRIDEAEVWEIPIKEESNAGAEGEEPTEPVAEVEKRAALFEPQF